MKYELLEPVSVQLSYALSKIEASGAEFVAIILSKDDHNKLSSELGIEKVFGESSSALSWNGHKVVRDNSLVMGGIIKINAGLQHVKLSSLIINCKSKKNTAEARFKEMIDALKESQEIKNVWVDVEDYKLFKSFFERDNEASVFFAVDSGDPRPGDFFSVMTPDLSVRISPIF